MSSRRKTVIVAAAALGITSAIGSPAFAEKPKHHGKDLVKAVTVEGVLNHLQQFQSIADANGGNRAASTPGYEASGAYVEQTLQAAGYETTRQTFTFTYQEVLETSLAEVSPNARDIAQIPMSYSPSTPEGGITGELATPAVATGCDAASYAGSDVTGKIVLVQRGVCSFAAKSLAGAAAGATAVLVYNNEAGELNGTLGAVDPASAPTSGLTQADGEALVAEIAAGPVTLTFNLQQLIEDRETFNVLAETKAGRADNVVMLGAHLDSVAEGPGINDNGSGSAAILEVAVQLAKNKKINNKVRFAFWGAEEAGLLGSTHYVNDLVENNPAELENLAVYLNFDMIGSPNYTIGVYDADQSTYPAPVEVPEGSTAAEDIFTNWFDGNAQPWVDTEFSGRSDYQAFIENGIPSTGLFTGAEELKTEAEAAAFGGTAGVAYDVNYHQVGDDINNINLEALDINSDAIANATQVLAMDTSSINGVTSPTKPGKGHGHGHGHGNHKPVPPQPEEDCEAA